MKPSLPLIPFIFLTLVAVAPAFAGPCGDAPSQGPALVVREQTPLHLEADPESEAVRSLPFATELQWYQDNLEFETVQVGGRKGANSFCGWVDTKTIKRGPPLRIDQLLDTETGTESDNPNPLLAKVIITNRSRIREGARGQAGERVEVRQAPRSDAKVVRRLGLYELFLVWDQHRDAQGQLWFLVGASEDLQRRFLLGWVRRQDTILWPHREAVYPRRGHVLQIYANDHMEEDGDPPMQTLAAVDERQRDFAVNKLPLLDRMPASQRRGSRERDAIATMSQRLNGGSVKEHCKGMNAAECAQQVTDWRSRLASAIRSAGQVDILVVMDNTESMGRYRMPILEGLREGLNAFAGKEVEARFAFAFYGDYFKDSERGWRWVRENAPALEPIMRGSVPRKLPLQLKLWDFGAPGELPTIQELADFVGSGGFDDPRNDYPEAPLAALATAVNGAGWQRTKFRLVLWLGDDGNRSLAQDPGGANMDEVVQALQAQGTALIPINVKGERDDQWNRAFVEQAEAIHNQLIQSGDGTTLPPYSVRNTGSQNEEMDRLKEGVKFYTMALFDVSLMPRALRYGMVPATGPGQPLPVKSRPRNLSLAKWQRAWLDKLVGIKDAQATLAEAARDTQQVQVGWVYGSTAGGESNLNYYVTMTDAELASLRYSLGQLCRATSSTDGVGRDFRRAVEDLVQVSIGEANFERNLKLREHLRFDPNEDLAKFYAKVLHLPKRTFSLFEGHNFNEIIDKLRQEAKPAESDFTKAVCKSAELLELIENAKYVESDWLEFKGVHKYKKKPIFEPKETRRPLRQFEWLWGLESGIRYYFVPVDFLPHR